MKNKTYWINWAKAAGIRALRTIAQTALSLMTCAVVLGDVDWLVVGSASLLAGIVSLLTSIVTGLPEVPLEALEAPVEEEVTTEEGE